MSVVSPSAVVYDVLIGSHSEFGLLDRDNYKRFRSILDAHVNDAHLVEDS